MLKVYYLLKVFTKSLVIDKHLTDENLSNIFGNQNQALWCSNTFWDQLKPKVLTEI